MTIIILTTIAIFEFVVILCALAHSGSQQQRIDEQQITIRELQEKSQKRCSRCGHYAHDLHNGLCAKCFHKTNKSLEV